MSIKDRINLVRSILYLQDVIRSGTISETAKKNGIKPSNLSQLLSELEETLGCSLLNRNHRGVTPTPEGLKIYNLVVELEYCLEKIENVCQNSCINPGELNVFISPELEMPGLRSFIPTSPELIIKFCKTAVDSDIAIFNHLPENPRANETRIKIGTVLQQNIWVSTNEKHPAAMELFDFIIAKLLF